MAALAYGWIAHTCIKVIDTKRWGVGCWVWEVWGVWGLKWDCRLTGVLENVVVLESAWTARTPVQVMDTGIGAAELELVLCLPLRFL